MIPPRRELDKEELVELKWYGRVQHRNGVNIFDAYEALRAERDEFERVLRVIEYAGERDTCPMCGCHKHLEICELYRVLARIGQGGET